MSHSQKRRSFRILLTLSILGGVFGLPRLVGLPQENAGNSESKPRVQIRFLEQNAPAKTTEQNPNGLPANKVDRSAIGTEPNRGVIQAPINVATEEERNQVIAPDWNNPWAVLFLTGCQSCYMEP
jgi:hypothetical protein